MQFSLWILVAVVGLMVSLSEAAIVGSRPSEDPAHAGKCWNPSSNTLHEVGEVYTDHENCVRVSCFSDFSMEWASCGYFGGGPSCHVVDGDRTLDYPKCCPTIKCDNKEDGMWGVW